MHLWSMYGPEVDDPGGFAYCAIEGAVVDPLLLPREGRVLVNALGHDAKARENPAFQQLLAQGVAWAAKR
jgi:type 1 glutamine amidotransferase